MVCYFRVLTSSNVRCTDGTWLLGLTWLIVEHPCVVRSTQFATEMRQLMCRVVMTLVVTALLVDATRIRNRSTRAIRNELKVKERAWRTACERHNCTSKIQCPYANGWHILGSDLGCCGNYGGCCQLASIVCWAHDLFCKCCDFGVFICGPLCEKDPDCPVEEGSGEIHDAKENITGV
ncbi:uncharacterized protein LOC124110957 isoform X1 [Haliotis rufescens]|uniref:uncharacterized protein LOC124110957 isoform X1 n=2 Tax=Haliotis rufescens TaxID=6454 RepID=UPI001EAF9777|nr:uncharacterized protein LOC124110957 isoform X1 [Haliotis rufescens]